MNANAVRQLVESELSRVPDSERQRLLDLLTSPTPLSIAWDYGKDGELLVCWKVGQSADGMKWLIYSPNGFGPSFP